MNIFNEVKNEGTLKLRFKKDFYLGHCRDEENKYFIDESFVIIQDEVAYIKENTIVIASIADNGWLQIKFPNEDFIDVAFDEDKEYNEYFAVAHIEMYLDNVCFGWKKLAEFFQFNERHVVVAELDPNGKEDKYYILHEDWLSLGVFNEEGNGLSYEDDPEDCSGDGEIIVSGVYKKKE